MFRHIYKLTGHSGLIIIRTYTGEYCSPLEAMRQMGIRLEQYKSYKYSGFSSDNDKWNDWERCKENGLTDLETYNKIYNSITV